MNNEVILDTDPGIIEWRTNIEGWVGKDGRFYGKDKSLAVYANSTHKKCEKGHIYRRGYTSCPDCLSATERDRYMKLPFEEWDGTTPLALYNDDNYFFDEDDVAMYLEDSELELEDLMLVICTPEYIPEVDEEYFIEALPEEWSLEETNKEVYQKLKELNETIRKAKSSCWFPGNKRTTIKL